METVYEIHGSRLSSAGSVLYYEHDAYTDWVLVRTIDHPAIIELSKGRFQKTMHFWMCLFRLSVCSYFSLRCSLICR